MSNAAGVRPLNPIDGYTRKLIQDFETAVFARAIAMSTESSSEDEDLIQYSEANEAYKKSKLALIRRISKLTATPNLESALDPAND